RGGVVGRVGGPRLGAPGHGSEGGAVSDMERPAEARYLSPWFQWMTRLQAVEPVDPLPVDDRSALDAWRVRCRERLTRLLGPWPDPGPLRLETLGQGPCAGYRPDKAIFDRRGPLSGPAHLSVPHGRTRPGP